MAEFDWIARYFAPLAVSERALGLSDDIAFLGSAEQSQIITQDTIVEGVHFLEGTPPETLAAKLVAVNASDIRSKGAQCTAALLALGYPNHWEEREVGRFASGLGEALAAFGADLLGGDTVSTHGHLFATLTMIGKPLGERVILRSGARNGDDVWVSGAIGHGIIGLHDAKAGRESSSAEHYKVPRITSEAVASLIGQFASASMDVSDGLLADALKLANASGVGITLNLEAIPFADRAEQRFLWLEQATGGDDYQSLFTAPSTERSALMDRAREGGSDIQRIGRVTDSGRLDVFRSGVAVSLPSKLGFAHGK